MAERALQQILHAGDDCIEIDGPRQQGLPSRKREQVARQHGAAFGRGVHRPEPLAQSRIERGGALDQFDIADQNGQQIVEVVGHAAGELAQCFDPLGLTQRRLGALALFHLLEQLPVRLLGPFLGKLILANQRLDLPRPLGEHQKQPGNRHTGA